VSTGVQAAALFWNHLAGFDGRDASRVALVLSYATAWSVLSSVEPSESERLRALFFEGAAGPFLGSVIERMNRSPLDRGFSSREVFQDAAALVDSVSADQLGEVLRHVWHRTNAGGSVNPMGMLNYLTSRVSR
jgi:hypothetical protein